MAQFQPSQYKDPVITKYIDLIKANNPGQFKMFYVGDPMRIPVSSLPALIISRKNTNVSYASNAEDRHDMQIVITVVTDIRADIADDKTITPGTISLYDFIEGRDPDTLVLKPTSLISILRKNVDLNQNVQLYTDVSMPTKVDYGITIGKRQPDQWALEASITIMATIIQNR